MTDLTKLAHELGEAIEASAEFKEYSEAKALQETSSELQMHIGEYNLKRMQLMNEMKKEPEAQDSAALEKMREEMNTAYETVISDPIMKRYSEAGEKLQELVTSVYGIINFHVTGEDPNAHSCSGDCHSCGGCH